ncbi:hypothetical protein pb186bvf_017114 [Paramecium bursaria]
MNQILQYLYILYRLQHKYYIEVQNHQTLCSLQQLREGYLSYEFSLNKLLLSQIDLMNFTIVPGFLHIEQLFKIPRQIYSFFISINFFILTIKLQYLEQYQLCQLFDYGN